MELYASSDENEMIYEYNIPYKYIYYIGIISKHLNYRRIYFFYTYIV